MSEPGGRALAWAGSRLSRLRRRARPRLLTRVAFFLALVGLLPLAIACTSCYPPSGYAILVNDAGSGSVKDGIILGNTFSYMAIGVDLTNATNWSADNDLRS